jgi:hypothetical protein
MDILSKNRLPIIRRRGLFEKAWIARRMARISSIRAGFNLKKISFSRIIDTVPRAIIKPTSNRTNDSTRPCLI